MFAKISLTAAFLLLVAPPIACASNRNATNPASSSPASQAGIVVAQDAQPNIGTSENSNDSDSDASDNDNDSDSNDNDDNQNADGSQMNEQNAAGGDDQPAQANGGDNDQNDSVPQFKQNPQQPENPNQ
jgi:hypothetical protein